MPDADAMLASWSELRASPWPRPDDAGPVLIGVAFEEHRLAFALDGEPQPHVAPLERLEVIGHDVGATRIDASEPGPFERPRIDAGVVHVRILRVVRLEQR